MTPRTQTLLTNILDQLSARAHYNNNLYQLGQEYSGRDEYLDYWKAIAPAFTYTIGIERNPNTQAFLEGFASLAQDEANYYQSIYDFLFQEHIQKEQNNPNQLTLDLLDLYIKIKCKRNMLLFREEEAMNHMRKSITNFMKSSKDRKTLIQRLEADCNNVFIESIYLQNIMCDMEKYFSEKSSITPSVLTSIDPVYAIHKEQNETIGFNYKPSAEMQSQLDSLELSLGDINEGFSQIKNDLQEKDQIATIKEIVRLKKAYRSLLSDISRLREINTEPKILSFLAYPSFIKKIENGILTFKANHQRPNQENTNQNIPQENTPPIEKESSLLFENECSATIKKTIEPVKNNKNTSKDNIPDTKHHLTEASTTVSPEQIELEKMTTALNLKDSSTPASQENKNITDKNTYQYPHLKSHKNRIQKIAQAEKSMPLTLETKADMLNPYDKNILLSLFEKPLKKNFKEKDLIGLIKKLGGTVTEGSGSRKRIHIENTTIDTLSPSGIEITKTGKIVVHSQHGSKKSSHGTYLPIPCVKSYRTVLEKAGFTPENLWPSENNSNSNKRATSLKS